MPIPAALVERRYRTFTNNPGYVKACELYELVWDDSKVLSRLDEILGLLITNVNSLKKKGNE